MSALLSTSHEMPIFLDAATGQLFGTYTTPARGGSDIGFVLCPAAGGWSGRNRVAARLCRRVAADGYHVIRFDYHGFADSSGLNEASIRTDRPFVDDLDAAIDFLRQRGVRRMVLGGRCFGAATVLACAPRVSQLAGLVLIQPPLRTTQMSAVGKTPIVVDVGGRDVLRKLRATSRSELMRSRRTRQIYARLAVAALRGKLPGNGQRVRAGAPGVIDTLALLAAEQTPIAFIFGSEDGPLKDLERARTGRLGSIWAAPGTRFELLTVPGPLQGFPTTGGQATMIDAIVAWLARNVRPDVVAETNPERAQHAPYR